jgi:glycosyltransferase involved in cell wall biosynthesis
VLSSNVPFTPNISKLAEKIGLNRNLLIHSLQLLERAELIQTLVKKSKSSRTFVVPNVYNNRSFEDYDFKNGFENKNVLLFVGTLSYKPNIDGLKWFIDNVFSEFKKKYVDALLIVVGRCPSKDIKALCKSREGVEIYSDVPDVKKYYVKCRALIVPILSGSGTRIKILEAALADTPVLSTPKGAEGLDFDDEIELLLFRTAEEFCAKYNWLGNEENFHLLIKNAKNAVLNKYSESKFNAKMEEILNCLRSH